MKKTILCLLAAAALLGGCEKEDPKSDSLPQLPELPDPTDVCSAMEDEAFKTVCLQYFDTDADGKLSPEEALKIISFELYAGRLFGPDIASLRGIEYFSELVDIYGYPSQVVDVLDLRYNRKIVQIRDQAFIYASGLERVVLPTSVLRIGHSAFEECSSLKQIALPSTLVVIGNKAFSGCRALEGLVLPQSVAQIGQYAFWNCSLTKITLPAKIKRIEEGTFQCSALERIEMPGVTSVGSLAFAGCGSLREIELPKTVEQIGFCVFSGCRNLEKITLPERLDILGSQLFSFCTALRSLVCRASTPPACAADTFENMPEGVTLYVPRKSVGLYAAHEIWSRHFARILPIGQ